MLKLIKPRINETRQGEEAMKTMLKSAIFKLEEELLELYTAPDDDGIPQSDSDILLGHENAETVRMLLERFLSPVILNILNETTQMELKCKELLTKVKQSPVNVFTNSSNSSNSSNSVTNSFTSSSVDSKGVKRKTSWSIYLSEHAINLPNWKDTISKISYASQEYGKLSQQQRQQIVLEYYVSRNIPVPDFIDTENKIHRVSGLDAFKRFWYDERKRIYPESGGLDPEACIADWKALSSYEQSIWKEIRKRQLAF